MPKKKYFTEEERVAGRKAANRSYYLKNRIKIIAGTSAWSKRNNKRVAENLRKWRKNNKAQAMATEKKWRAENIETCRATARNSYYRHSEKRKAKHSEWSKNNPATNLFHSSLRRKNSKLHPHANKKAIKAVYSESRSLTDLTSIKHVVDHIIPVIKGGPHHEDNLQPMPKGMNSSKHGNPFWLAPSPAYKDWRDVPRELWPVDLAPKYLELIEQNKGASIRWDTAA